MSATGHYLTDNKGGKTAVELPVESYEKLQDALTDLPVIATMSVAPSLAPAAD